jgi:hypothetical protein
MFLFHSFWPVPHPQYSTALPISLSGPSSFSSSRPKVHPRHLLRHRAFLLPTNTSIQPRFDRRAQQQSLGLVQLSPYLDPGLVRPAPPIPSGRSGSAAGLCPLSIVAGYVTSPILGFTRGERSGIDVKQSLEKLESRD